MIILFHHPKQQSLFQPQMINCGVEVEVKKLLIGIDKVLMASRHLIPTLSELVSISTSIQPLHQNFVIGYMNPFFTFCMVKDHLQQQQLRLLS